MKTSGNGWQPSRSAWLNLGNTRKVIADAGVPGTPALGSAAAAARSPDRAETAVGSGWSLPAYRQVAQTLQQAG
jgi:hypothetical protein